MSAAARSILAFGVYMMGQGLVMVVAPDLLLGLFGFPPVQDVWPRVVGWALMVLGYYYVRAALRGLTDFFRWTVGVRIAQFGFFLAIVLTGLVKPTMLAFSGFELLMGLWTGYALRQERLGRRELALG